MSTIPLEALPRLRSLTANVDGHALVLLDSPIRRVSAFTLTLKGSMMFGILQGFESQPTFISGEIAHNAQRLLSQACERFPSVVIPSREPAIEVHDCFL